MSNFHKENSLFIEKRKFKKALRSSILINWKNSQILQQVSEIISPISPQDIKQQSIALFNWVRDNISYKVTMELNTPHFLKASSTLKRGTGHCVSKAILLTAFLRAAKIPARIHFKDLKNHLIPKNWVEKYGEKLLYHGYTEVFLENRWIAATPAYDKALCERKGYSTVIFDGIHDAFFPKTNLIGEPFMEYVKDKGIFYRIPYFRIVFAWIFYYTKIFFKLRLIKKKKKKNKY